MLNLIILKLLEKFYRGIDIYRKLLIFNLTDPKKISEVVDVSIYAFYTTVNKNVFLAKRI